MVFVLNSTLILDTRHLVFYNPSPPRMFLSLDLLLKYRIQHGAIGSLYVTYSYSTWIFCRGVSGWLCNWLVSWINQLPPACWSTFWKSIFKQQLGCRCDIMDDISYFLYFDICNYICLDTSYHYTPASTKLIGGYTGITLSVCPSVRPSVRLSVCPSVDRIVSALYLQQCSSDPFHICTSYQATLEGVSRLMPVSKFKNLKFWRIFLNL